MLKQILPASWVSHIFKTIAQTDLPVPRVLHISSILCWQICQFHECYTFLKLFHWCLNKSHQFHDCYRFLTLFKQILPIYIFLKLSNWCFNKSHQFHECNISLKLFNYCSNRSYQLHECLHFSDFFWKTDEPVVVEDQGLKGQLAERGRKVAQLISTERKERGNYSNLTSESTLNVHYFKNKLSLKRIW